MKKNFLLTVCLCVLFAVFACSCTEITPSTSGDDPTHTSSSESTTPQGPELVSIEIDVLPATIYYGLNDTPAWQGIRILARYDDGTTSIIPFVDCEFSEVDFSTYGIKTVTVSYQGCSTQFEIYVMEGVEFVPNSDTEKPYLFENISGIGSVNDRFADEKAYWTYKFISGEGKKFLSANIEMTIRNEYVVAVSFDNVDYTVIAEGATGANRVDFATINVNLDEFVNFEENTGALYIKFYDGVNTDGFGASMSAFSIYYLTEEYEGGVTEYAKKTITFAATSADEAQYLYENSKTGINNEESKRWADNDAYFIYKLELGKEIKTAVLSLVVENQAKIEVSFDGETWVTIGNAVEENANDCGKYFSNVTTTLNVNVTENTGVMYVRFSDADTSDGFGCCLYNFSIEAQVVPFDGDDNVSTDPIDGIITFAATSAEEVSYLYENSNTGIDTESGKRWADNNAYFIYKLELGKEIETAVLSLVVENQAKIEVSFDGETWVTIGNAVEENANDCGKYFSNVTTTLNVNVTENTGVMYVRFSDADTSDGFGCCLYNFSATLTC